MPNPIQTLRTLADSAPEPQKTSANDAIDIIVDRLSKVDEFRLDNNIMLRKTEGEWAVVHDKHMEWDKVKEDWRSPRHPNGIEANRRFTLEEAFIVVEGL